MKPWKRLVWALAASACLVGAVLLWRGDRNAVAELTPQQAAENWETEEKPYAMASVFLREENAIAQQSIGEIYLNIENALTAGGVDSEDHPWFYAASYQTEATLVHEVAVCEVELTAVAGDFFRVHPMELINGWYMDEDDMMHDRIVLSRGAAWDLFYSDNAAGMFVQLNGQNYQVAAVVDLETGKYNDLAAGDVKRAWVFADSPGLSNSAGTVQTESEGTVDFGTAADMVPGFTCMEMVLPQPVKNFAVSTMRSALSGFIPDDTVITDNSARFGLKNRWDVLRDIGVRGISMNAVSYPYWENAARLTENHLALRLVPEGLLMCVPIVSLLILLLWLNRRRTWGLHSIRDAIENAVERKRRRDYDARQRGAVPEKRRNGRKRPKHKSPRREWEDDASLADGWMYDEQQYPEAQDGAYDEQYSEDPNWDGAYDEQYSEDPDWDGAYDEQYSEDPNWDGACDEQHPDNWDAEWTGQEPGEPYGEAQPGRKDKRRRRQQRRRRRRQAKQRARERKRALKYSARKET